MGKRMGIQSEIIAAGFASRVSKIKGKSCLPVGCAGLIALCAGFYEMAKVMDFTALQAYINGFIKLFGK